MEGIGGAAEVGAGLPPLEGGTTISAKIVAEEMVGEMNVEAHAVECGGGGVGYFSIHGIVKVRYLRWLVVLLALF